MRQQGDPTFATILARLRCKRCRRPCPAFSCVRAGREHAVGSASPNPETRIVGDQQVGAYKRSTAEVRSTVIDDDGVAVSLTIPRQKGETDLRRPWRRHARSAPFLQGLLEPATRSGSGLY
jgi:L-lactate utilization protein LutB